MKNGALIIIVSVVFFLIDCFILGMIWNKILVDIFSIPSVSYYEMLLIVWFVRRILFAPSVNFGGIKNGAK